MPPPRHFAAATMASAAMLVRYDTLSDTPCQRYAFTIILITCFDFRCCLF